MAVIIVAAVQLAVDASTYGTREGSICAIYIGVAEQIPAHEPIAAPTALGLP